MSRSYIQDYDERLINYITEYVREILTYELKKGNDDE